MGDDTGCGECGTCCSKFAKNFLRPAFFWFLPFALGMVMAGFATAAILDRETAMVTFGGFRWMLLTALIYEFILFLWAMVESIYHKMPRHRNCEMIVHLMLTIMWIFPYSIFQLTWHENKYQTDANWRSAWDTALVFAMLGSFVPALVRAIAGAVVERPSSGYTQMKGVPSSF